jgi:Periplasmic binding protein
MTGRARRRAGNLAFASPRISDRALAGHPGSSRVPAPHTAAEISALVTLLRQAGASTIAVGHGRHASSCDTATALTEAWDRAGGIVLSTVNWPARAASWLKPARQLIRAHPDAWVIADNPAGCAQLVLRLAGQEPWSAARTFGTAATDSPDLAALAGCDLLAGMRGVTADGRTWRIG